MAGAALMLLSAPARGSGAGAAPPHPGVTLSALGDSTGAGVGARDGRGGYVDRLFARLQRAGRARRLVNLCESGATTSDVLQRQVARVSSAQPGLVTIGVGVNDLTRDGDVDGFARRLGAVIEGVRARTAAPIVLSNLPDASLAPALSVYGVRPLIAQRVREFNDVIAAAARRHRLVLFDAFAMSHQVLPAHPEFFSPDGFHPSEHGYQVWADALWELVQPLVD